MSTPKMSKKTMTTIALVAVVFAAAAYAVTKSGGSEATKPKAASSASPNASGDAEAKSTEVNAMVEKAIAECKNLKISCLNAAGVAIYEKHGLESMLAYTELVANQAPKSFQCVKWGEQLGSEMYKRFGKAAVDMKYTEVCQGAYFTGIFREAGKSSKSSDVVAVAKPLCASLQIKAPLCGYYTAITGMGLSDKNLKVTLGACDLLKDESAARSCGSALLYSLDRAPSAADIAVCEEATGAAAAGCANIAAGFILRKGVPATDACASFLGIAMNDCEYGYGYFASSRGATDAAASCGDSAWCARGFGWGASVAGGPSAGAAACAKLSGASAEACVVGSKMMGYRDASLADRPEPFSSDNFTAAAPKKS